VDGGGDGPARGLPSAPGRNSFLALGDCFGWLDKFRVAAGLGMGPGQVGGVDVGGTGGIRAGPLVAGVGLDYLLTQLIMPVLYITDFVERIDSGTPAPVVVPMLLNAALLGVVICTCVVALALMARLVSRPSLSQTLRLNED